MLTTGEATATDYLAGGLCTVFSMNWIVSLVDRSANCAAACLDVVVRNNSFGRDNKSATSAFNRRGGNFNPADDCGLSGGFGAAMSMMTATIEVRYRAVMSINSSVQQFRRDWRVDISATS
jgi:hypothetical protein